VSAWDRYVETGTDGLTFEELEALQDAFQTAVEHAAHQYKKGE
jgi:hypothetical protein